VDERNDLWLKGLDFGILKGFKVLKLFFISKNMHKTIRSKTLKTNKVQPQTTETIQQKQRKMFISKIYS
jgi:hypothetical protein